MENNTLELSIKRSMCPMAKEVSDLRMEAGTLDHGKTVKCMDMGFLSGESSRTTNISNRSMMDGIFKARNKERERFILRLEITIKETGRMENKMVKVYFTILKTNQ